jgi:calcyclin binding protein
MQLDVDELKTLIEKSTRPNIKQMLSTTLEKWEAQIKYAESTERDRLARLESSKKDTTTLTGGYTKKIDSYGWDQSDKFVKIYITCLKDVNTVKESDVVTKFSEK